MWMERCLELGHPTIGNKVALIAQRCTPLTLVAFNADKLFTSMVLLAMPFTWQAASRYAKWLSLVHILLFDLL
jgi:hypothetical protein